MPTLNWIGKEAVVNHHLKVPFHLLKDVPELACGEPGNGNLIVQDDNCAGATAAVRRTTGHLLRRLPARARALAGGAPHRPPNLL